MELELAPAGEKLVPSLKKRCKTHRVVKRPARKRRKSQFINIIARNDLKYKTSEKTSRNPRDECTFKEVLTQTKITILHEHYLEANNMIKIRKVLDLQKPELKWEIKSQDSQFR